LNVKVKGQGHHGQKWHFSALSLACVGFMFGKTSLASSQKSVFDTHIAGTSSGQQMSLFCLSRGSGGDRYHLPPIINCHHHHHHHHRNL